MKTKKFKSRQGYYVEAVFEIIETLLSFFSNTVSFIRVGAFALNHVARFMAFQVMQRMLGGVGGVAVMIFGNILIIGLEGLIVFIQGLRIQYYELSLIHIFQPSILILDDTTSALDMETEFEVFSNLRKKEQTQTTFIIAHRISSVKDADLILVMDKGEVVEQGTHQELLEMKGQYYDIFCQQMGAVQDGREAV